MVPAAASARLAKLERLVGADLLKRSTRKVSLSLEGAEFLPYAREILAQEEAAFAVLGKGKAEAKDTLRFAAPSTFAQLFIAPILPEFVDDHPGIDLDLRLSDTRFDLINGSFDLALRSSVLEDTSLKGRKLADDTRIFCASPAFLEKSGMPQTPDDLSRHRVVGFMGLAPRPLVGRNGEKALFDPRHAWRRLALDDGLSQKVTTLAGAGISMNSLWSVYREIADGSLVRVLPDYEVDDQSVLWLVYPKSNVLTTKVRVFIDFLLDKIGRNPPWISDSSD